MKIRTDFVTNSSSSSFVACGVFSKELADFVRQMLGGAEQALSKERLGALHIIGDIISITTNLTASDYMYIRMSDDDDLRSKKEKEEDDEYIVEPWNIASIIFDFLPEMTEQQAERCEELLTRASAARGIIGKTYVDSTDSFEFVTYSLRDFLLQHYKRDKDGKVIGYREQPGQTEPLQILPYLTIGGGAFRNCRSTTHIITGFPGNMEAGAFAGCSSLEELTVSMGVRNIPSGLCKGCTALRKVNLPEHIYVIQESAFAGCANLEEINIPETVMLIQPNAFSGCEKLPAAVLEKISALSDEGKFQRTIAEAVAYIQTHGDTKFRLDYDYLGLLLPTRDAYEKWHELFDPWFDHPQTLPKENIKYMGYGAVEEDMTAYGWQRQQNFGNRLNILVVDTANIPQFSRFISKQQALAKGDLEQAERYSKTILEKAIDLKKSGHPILIITRAHLRHCIAANAFAEAPYIPKKPAQPEPKAPPVKEEKPSKKAKELEQVASALREHCATTGKKFDSLPAVSGFILEMGFKPDSFRPLIAKVHDMTLSDYFVHIGVLSTPLERFGEMMDALQARYRAAGRKVKTFRQLEEENPDMDIASINFNARAYSGETASQLLIRLGILCSDEEVAPKSAPESAPRESDSIPEKTRKKMNGLFVRLDDAYPDKVIVGLNRDHKKWGETVTALYRELGYDSPKAFLEAYGYTYVADSKGGRPKKNPMDVIEQLRSRYPNGGECGSVGELKEANPDLAAEIKSLENKSKELFGMPFGKYLRSIGLIR